MEADPANITAIVAESLNMMEIEMPGSPTSRHENAVRMGEMMEGAGPTRMTLFGVQAAEKARIAQAEACRNDPERFFGNPEGVHTFQGMEHLDQALHIGRCYDPKAQWKKVMQARGGGRERPDVQFSWLSPDPRDGPAIVAKSAALQKHAEMQQWFG